MAQSSRASNFLVFISNSLPYVYLLYSNFLLRINGRNSWGASAAKPQTQEDYSNFLLCIKVRKKTRCAPAAKPQTEEDYDAGG
jgi:hypothetical protein